jgi:hypothetical protein
MMIMMMMMMIKGHGACMLGALGDARVRRSSHRH